MINAIKQSIDVVYASDVKCAEIVANYPATRFADEAQCTDSICENLKQTSNDRLR